MRPESIRKFDLFYLAAVAISVVSALLNWDQSTEAMRDQLAPSNMQDMAETLLAVGIAVGVGIGLLLWFLASRARLGVAKWLILAFVLYRAVSIPYALSLGVGTLSITGLVVVLLQAIAVWFLFRPDAREWFATRGG